MGWNKDDGADESQMHALKCMKIVKDALESGDEISALQFLAMALYLDPTLPTDDLLSAPDCASSPKSEEKQRKKDFYEILGLERGFTVNDVQSAFQKLPDKKKVPGAEEAFKAMLLLGQRTAVRPAQQTAVRPAQRIAVRPAQQIATSSAQRVYPYRRKMRQEVEEGDVFPQDNSEILQVIFLVVLIIMIIFVTSSIDTPEFVFSKTNHYKYEFVTAKGVNYFVEWHNFSDEYPLGSTARNNFEKRVELVHARKTFASFSCIKFWIQYLWQTLGDCLRTYLLNKQTGMKVAVCASDQQEILQWFGVSEGICMKETEEDSDDGGQRRSQVR